MGLMFAARNGHKDVVALLLVNNANINHQTSSGWTALMSAAYKGHKDIVALLLLNNANINKQNKFGWTALMLAAAKGWKEVVELLITRRADISLQNKWDKNVCSYNERVDNIIPSCLSPMVSGQRSATSIKPAKKDVPTFSSHPRALPYRHLVAKF